MTGRPDGAYVAALKMLARRELSESQVRGRLTRRQFDPDEIDAAVARLRRERALDDQRTALACARQMTAAIPWVVGAASVAAIAALLALCVPAGIRVVRASGLADCVAVGLGGLATVAVVWEASALFWVPACG